MAYLEVSWCYPSSQTQPISLLPVWPGTLTVSANCWVVVKQAFTTLQLEMSTFYWYGELDDTPDRAPDHVLTWPSMPSKEETLPFSNISLTRAPRLTGPLEETRREKP